MLKQKHKQWLTAYLFLLPALIIIGVFVFYPVFYSIAISFTYYKIPGKPVFIGLDNYKLLLTDEEFWIALKNSLLYLLVVPVIQLLSILLAVFVNQQIKGINIFRAAFYLPVITSVVAVSIAWRWLFDTEGPINQILLSWHFLKQPIYWLTSREMALFSVMVVTTWKGLGYYMMIYLAGLQVIPKEYEEAARLDGANFWHVFFNITIPLLKPSIILCCILSSIAALKVFGEIYVLTEGGPNRASLTMVYYIYQQAFKDFNMGYAAAISLALSVVTCILAYLNFRYFSKGGLTYYN